MMMLYVKAVIEGLVDLYRYDHCKPLIVDYS